MKEIFEQYGGAIITVIAVVALAALIKFVLKSDASSPVYTAFSDLIKGFSANGQAGVLF